MRSAEVGVESSAPVAWRTISSRARWDSSSVSNGARSTSVSRPIIAIAALTGTGFGPPTKLAFIRGSQRSWIRRAVSQSPANAASHISAISPGISFEQTEMTPYPPSASIGSVHADCGGAAGGADRGGGPVRAGSGNDADAGSARLLGSDLQRRGDHPLVLFVAQRRGLARRGAGHEAVNAGIDLAPDEAAEGVLIDCAGAGERCYLSLIHI